MSDDICQCGCHSSPMLHMVACCWNCPDCGQNIRTDAWKQHSETCKPDDDDVPQLSWRCPDCNEWIEDNKWEEHRAEHKTKQEGGDEEAKQRAAV
jgi:hypothetical protein